MKNGELPGRSFCRCFWRYICGFVGLLGTRYGQRDVKNISSYVGTRSPTQVRTHAQKYFLKQRREETAQMKSASTLARKRRLTMTTAAAEEDEEDEEPEEDEEFDDDEDDEELDLLTKASSSTAPAANMDVDPSEDEPYPPRRKSTRASNAAAVIKLRTQDVVAHTQANASSSAKSGTGKRTGTNGSDSLVGSHGFSSSATNGSSASPSAVKVKPDPTMASASTGGSGATQGRKSLGSSNTSVSASSSSLSAPIASQTKSYATSANYAASALANTARGSTPQPNMRGGPSVPMATVNPAATLYGMSSMSGYGVNGVNGVSGVNGAFYGASNYVPFRIDIFASAEEAAQFYKAVKMYERETDRSKVLAMMKEYYLPRRTIEELSTMVDLAFPSADAASNYNAAVAAAAAASASAAFHPMYTSNQARAPMYFTGDTAASSSAATSFAPTHAASSSTLGAFGSALDLANPNANRSGLHASNASSAAPPMLPSVKLDPSHPYSATAAMLGYHTAANLAGGPQSFTVPSIGDFSSAQTHIDSSSLTSISDHMMGDHMNHKDPRNNGLGHQNGRNSDPSPASVPERTLGLPTPSNPTNPTNPPTTTNNVTNSASTSATQPATAQNSTSTASSVRSTAPTTKKKDHEDDDSSLMNELASLTERSLTQDNSSGGLSSFIGGRPLALSPGVFGSSGTTPLGFGMTPLMANSTPLGFISSPLGLNFPSAPSPINPYHFGSHK